jgi:hypothetical protein
VLIVIHVPQSDAAPHQARDHKYYQRLGRRLQPLKHRAIFDIAGRRRFPKLKTTILVFTGGDGRQPYMFWRLQNFGSISALHWMVIVKFPTAINGNGVCFVDENRTIEETEDGHSFLEMRIHQKLNSPPLFPESDISGSFGLSPTTFTPPLKPSIDEIRIRTFADDMPPLDERINVQDVLRSGGRVRPWNRPRQR